MTVPPTTQIAFATDQAGIGPCALAIDTALRATTGKVAVHLLHSELDEGTVTGIKNVVGSYQEAELHLHPMQKTKMQDVAIDHLYITTMTLARLLLPEILNGRVIYLDFDTIIRGDLAALAQIDLQGHVAAAVRDFGIVDMRQWALHTPENASAKHKRRAARAKKRLADTEARIGKGMTEDYFNAGVLLLDCDAISNDPTLAKQIRDVEAASKFELMDQDWLNTVLKGRVLLIDPKWNSFWGNPKSGTSRYTADMQDTYAASRNDPAIVHFSGRFKPWDFHLSHYYSHRRRWIWRFHWAQLRFWWRLRKAKGPAKA
ncbi:glycosyltransferase [Yoonia sp. BS5-3]|uniref:Glycosyltransferase family 8 protein n=1 Tax=Yoonia phaeophyticola TaxID=3137369 RepID=A0ABZ2V008_9RHOB